jgi:hypothetical protein
LGTYYARRCNHCSTGLSGRSHLDAAEGVGGIGEILVKADEGLTAFRLRQMKAIRKVHTLPHPAQRLRRGGRIFQTRARSSPVNQFTAARTFMNSS